MSSASPHATAILLAGGSGSRMVSTVADKILHKINEKPIFKYSIKAFLENQQVKTIVIVYRDLEQRKALELLTSDISSIEICWALGGAERQFSVWTGLQAAPDNTDIVLIHDCARPLVTADAIKQSIAAAATHGAACVARKTTDTIKKANPHSGSPAFTLSTVDRSNLWSMETPQVFQYELIYNAYQHVIETKQTITDDLSAIESNQSPVVFIPNGRANPKITTPEDAAYIEFLINHHQL